MSHKTFKMLCCLIVLNTATSAAVLLYAQTSVAETPSPVNNDTEKGTALPVSVPPPSGSDGIMTSGELEQASRIMDIKTASYADLVDMCIQAGLDSTGGAEALRSRIASHYKVTLPSNTKTAASSSADDTKQSGGTRYITIESANSTKYITVEDAGEYIKLSGNVVVSIKDNNNTCTISAEDVTYDREHDKIHARGNIRFERKAVHADSSDVFTGKAFMFDIADMKGVFLDGTTTHDAGKSNSDPYVVSAHSIGSNEEGTMSFSKATMTTCSDPNPHWKIVASRIWILPGNEFAILNGVMYIGSIPVFYLPFIYYPSDDMIFHPVFGTRTREGKFVQTTTYLIGRKRAEKSTENNIANLFQSDTDMIQERHGLFLKNTDKKETSTDTSYLKLLLDAYTKLGGMAAIDASLKPGKSISELKFFAGAALSRTIYGSHTYNADGESTWNNSNFLGMNLPFRYKIDVSTKMTFPNFSMTVSLPILSDPYFNNDFTEKRSETLNWLANFLGGSDDDDDDVTTTASLPWSISGTAKIPVEPLSPWIDSIQVSSFKSSVTLYNKQDVSAESYDPARYFYYPSTITPLDIRLSISGTLFSTQAPTEKEQEAVPSDADPSLAVDLTPPWTEPEKTDEAAASAESTTSENDIAWGKRDDYVPALKITPSATTSILPSFKLTYSFAPVFSSEIQYDPSKWESANDVDWTDIKSMYYNTTGTFTLSGIFNWQSFISSTTSFSGYAGWQEHPYLSDKAYATDSARNSIQLTDYKAQKYYLQAKESFSVKPLAKLPRFSASSFGWEFSGKLVRSEYVGLNDTTVDLEPKWANKTIEWDTDSIDSHTASALLNCHLLDYDQKISVTANLPPTVGSVQFNSGFGHSRLNLSVSTKYYQKSEDDDEWLWNSLTTTLNWSILSDLKLSQSLVYDIEEDLCSSYSATLSWKTLSIAFKMVSSNPYTFKEGAWIADSGDKDFFPSTVSLSYSATVPTLYLWKNRIAFSLSGSTSLTLNLLKLTESSFSFSPKISFKIHQYTDFSFSSLSTNNVIARYFDSVDYFGLPDMPGESNPFLDLLHSFYFWDTEARRQSGFKLKSLTFSLTQQLHDWQLKASLDIAPELNKTSRPYFYEYVPEFTLMVTWKPISDLKAEISYKDDVFKLNP